MSAVIQITPHIAILRSELRFAFTRSQGPGGQNVNKLSTRVEIYFDVRRSSSLNDTQKERVLSVLKSRVDVDGILRIAAQESRSQWQNRVVVVERFVEMMRRALKPKRKRIPTSKSAGARQKAHVKKKLHGEKKKARRKIDQDEV